MREKYIYSGSLLLADISGFTELTEKLALQGKKGTEDLTEILNRYFCAMYEIVRKHGGIVISSAGDSILVRFPPGKSPEICADQMMREMENFENLKSSPDISSFSIKIILGYGSWAEFIIGNRETAHIFLSGMLIEKLARAEDAAEKDEIRIIHSDIPVSLDDYNSPDLPDSSFYLPGTADLHGEHRSITSIFVNLEGYDKNSPPHRRIRKLYLKILDIVRKYNGIIQMIDNVLVGGSRIFLLFGAPVSYGNDLIHAVGASLEISCLLSAEDSLQIKAGIDEGFAFAGVIGDERNRQYTVIGDVVNTAARLADSAAPGEIIVSERVYRMSRNHFEYRVLDSIPLKGKKGLIKRFSPIVKRNSIKDRYRFVGRKKELSRILSAISGKKSIIEIEGDAGVGKTSLLIKLIEQLEDAGYYVLYGASPEHGETNGLFASLIGNMSGMFDYDSLDIRKEKLLNLLLKLDNSAGNLLEREVFFGKMLFSLNYPDSDYDTLPPKLRRENLLDGICEVFRSHKKPLCVILEDIHQASDEDIEAIEYITRQLHADEKTIFVLSKRLEGRKPFLEDDSHVERMLLEGLENEASNELMIEILGGKPLEKDIEILVRDRANGNPFYLMQFLLYLIEENLLSNKNGVWVRTELYSDDKLPGNIFSMIMARVDRLEVQAKESLMIGSVAGVRFEEEIVRMVLKREVHGNLMDCTEAGLTFQSELKDLEFVFSHTLIRDVSYDSILRKRRKEIHGTIGSILEDLHRGKLESICSVLAYHFLTAEKWDKALEYSVMAGEKAWSEYRNLNAIRFFLDGVSIIENHMENNHDRLTNCFNYLGKIHDRLGNYDRALEYYNRALNSSDNLKLTGEISLSIADIFYTRGEIDRSFKLLDTLEDKLSRNTDGNDVLSMRIECFRAWTFCVVGKIDLAMKRAQKGIELAENLTDCEKIECSRLRGFSYNTIATVYWAEDNYMKAKEYYLRALNIALSNNMKREIAVTYGNIGLISDKLGDFAEAINSFKKQLSFSRIIGDKLLILSSQGAISSVYSTMGLFGEALESSMQHRQLAEELPSLQDLLTAHNQIGMLHLVMGKSEIARALGNKGLGYLKTSSYEREEALLLLLLALVSTEEEDMDTAESRIAEAEKLARKVQSKTLLYSVLVSRADLLLRTGKSAGFRELIEEAENLVSEMGTATGMAKIHHLYGKWYFSVGEPENGSLELDKAAEISKMYGMKPALADTLKTHCALLDMNNSPVEKQNSMMMRVRELEKEMGISVRMRSTVLQII